MAVKDISDRQICAAYDVAKGLQETWPYDLLMLWTGQPQKVCYRAMERAMKRGLIECGVSLRTGWLTPKGRSMLDALHQAGFLATPEAKAEAVSEARHREFMRREPGYYVD